MPCRGGDAHPECHRHRRIDRADRPSRSDHDNRWKPAMPDEDHPYRDATDQWLLDRARSQDQAAATELYRRYHLYSRALALDTGASRCDVDDIAAEAWTRILARMAQGRGPNSNFRSYLAQTIRNTAVDHWRRQRRVTLTDQFEDAASPPDPGLDEKPLLTKAMAALNSLPVSQRQLLAESFSACPVPTAQRVGISDNALANRLSRARRALRRAYFAHRTAT